MKTNEKIKKIYTFDLRTRNEISQVFCRKKGYRFRWPLMGEKK